MTGLHSKDTLKEMKLVGGQLNTALWRFLLVGLCCAGLSYLTFRLCYVLLPPKPETTAIAQLIGYLAGMIVSFVGNRSWTFRSGKKVSLEVLRFMVLQVAMAVLSSLLLCLIVDYFRLMVTPSWVGVTAMVTSINYIGLRYWVFGEVRDLSGATGYFAENT